MVAAQSIPILGSLCISRLYSPADFGSFSAWLGIVVTVAVLITGRFETALAVEPDGEPRKFAFKATLATSILAISALSLVASLGYLVAPRLRQLPTSLVLFSFPAALLLAMIQTWQSWAAAEGAYRQLSWMRIAQALGVTGFQIIVGYVRPSAISLAFGHLMGGVLGLCVAAHYMPIDLRSLRPWSKFSAELRQFWKSHRRFPTFSLPADIINSASGQLPTIIIASRFGVEASGVFALTGRILGAPIALIGGAFLDVFKRTASASYRTHGNCREEYLRTFKVLSLGGVLLAAGVMCAAEPIFVLLFGEPWRQSGVIAVWLMPMFALRFVASPLSYVFYITGKQHVDLAWQCFLLVMTLATFILSKSFQVSVESYAIGYAFLYLIYLSLSYRYSN